MQALLSAALFASFVILLTGAIWHFCAVSTRRAGDVPAVTRGLTASPWS